MLTLGVDLAAEPGGTGMAEIEWIDGTGTAKLVDLRVGVSNQMIVASSLRAAKVGIDCPLGWPDEFVDFVGRHSQGMPPAESEHTGIDWRRRLAFRETDRFVHERIKKWPLSVSADRLGLTAMRCAVVVAELAARGANTDRSGSGLVVEVYPAAALRWWSIAAAASKRTSAGLSDLVDLLHSRAPWLDLGVWTDLVRESHDAFDAVVSSVIARASALGLVAGPPRGVLEQAGREGWIALPTVDLAALPR